MISQEFFIVLRKNGGFELKAFFDKERQELINKVTFRRKPLQTRVLDDRLSQSYVGYQLIIADLNSVLDWANIALKLLEKNVRAPEDKAILHSLFISMITTYWKCFADTKGRHGVQLNKKFVAKEHYETHEELKRIRHNFAAHCGEDPFESGYLLLVKDVVGKDRFNPVTIPIHRKAGHSDKLLTDNISKLVTSIIEKIRSKQKNY